MNICNLIEIMESYGSVRIEKKFSGDLIFVGNSFEVPENLYKCTVSMIRARDSTLIVYI